MKLFLALATLFVCVAVGRSAVISKKPLVEAKKQVESVEEDISAFSGSEKLGKNILERKKKKEDGKVTLKQLGDASEKKTDSSKKEVAGDADADVKDEYAGENALKRELSEKKKVVKKEKKKVTIEVEVKEKKKVVGKKDCKKHGAKPCSAAGIAEKEKSGDDESKEKESSTGVQKNKIDDGKQNLEEEGAQPELSLNVESDEEVKKETGLKPVLMSHEEIVEDENTNFLASDPSLDKVSGEENENADDGAAAGDEEVKVDEKEEDAAKADKEEDKKVEEAAVHEDKSDEEN